MKKNFEILFIEIFSEYFKNLVTKKFSDKNFFAGVLANLKKIKKNFRKFFRNFSKKKISKFFFHLLKLAKTLTKKISKKKFPTKF